MSTTESTPDLTTERGGFYCEAPAHVLEGFLAQFSKLVAEIRLETRQSGLHAKAIDPASVAGVVQTLEQSGFDHYSSTGGMIGVDLERLEDVLSLADRTDVATLELDQETRKLEIEIDGMEYTLGLIDPESVRKGNDIPDLELPVTVRLEATHLRRAVTAADMVSDHIRFRALEADPDAEGDDTGRLVIEAEGDTDDMSLELNEGDELLELDMDGEADSLFSLEYLEDLVKVIPTGGVTLSLGTEMPAILEFDHLERADRDDDGEDGAHGEVTQLLAPRISSE